MQPSDVSVFLSGAEITPAETPDMVLRRLGPADYDLLLHFRAEIDAQLGNPDLMRLMPDEAEFVEQSLRPENLALALFRDGKLAAYTSFFLPNSDEDLRELHIYEQAHPRAPAAEIGYVGGLMVAPAHRGRMLQRCLISERMIVMAKIGRPHHFSTQGFGNYFSWRNALAMGARVVDVYDFLDPRHGPTSRLLSHWNPAAPPLAEETIWFHCLDIAAQRDCLRNGLVGTEYRMSNGRAEIGYRREIA